MPAPGRGEGPEGTDVTVDEDGQVLVPGLGRDPVERHLAKAAAAECPARREWAVMRVPSSPAASARERSMRATTFPESGSRLIVLAQSRVNTHRVSRRGRLARR